MSNNLPDKCEQSFIFKIKRFFLKVFNKNEKVEIDENIFSSADTTIEVKEDMFSNVREVSKKQKLEEEILNIIEAKPELVETLSIKQLEVISRNYDRIIGENEKKINKLKRALAQ